METGYACYLDACQGVSPIRIAGTPAAFCKGQVIFLVIALPIAATAFRAAGLI